jgi:hypothetical protein
VHDFGEDTGWEARFWPVKIVDGRKAHLFFCHKVKHALAINVWRK